MAELRYRGPEADLTAVKGSQNQRQSVDLLSITFWAKFHFRPNFKPKYCSQQSFLVFSR